MIFEQLDGAARQLAAAQAAGARPIAALDPAPLTVEEAYRIQAATALRLGPVGGWKHGLLGGKTLSCAPIFASAIHKSGATLPLIRNLRVEVETAIRLAAPLRAGASLPEIRAAIGSIHLAFECLGSRFAEPVKRTPLEVMADRFSNSAVVLGNAIPDWQAYDLADLPISTAEPALGALRTPGLSLPETLEFLGFLAARAEEQGLTLGAGQVIITGARLGPVPVSAPIRLSAWMGDASVELALE